MTGRTSFLALLATPFLAVALVNPLAAEWVEYGGPFGDPSVPSYGASHTLTASNPNWSTNFGEGSYAAFQDTLYAVAGASPSGDDTGTGTVEAHWEPGYLQMGRGWWYYGQVLYKFQAGAGQTFEGGTISAGLNRGTSHAMYLETITSQPELYAIAPNPGGVEELGLQAWTSFAKTNDNGSGAQDIEVAIPSGVSEFWLMVGKEQSAGKDWFNHITVNANVIPEPGSLVLLVVSLCLGQLVRRRK